MRIHAVLTVLIIFLAQVRGQSRNDWYIFRGDPELTGISRSTFPENPVLLWSFQAGDELRSPPVVSGDYIVTGCMDGKVFCVDRSGKLVWQFETENGIEAPALAYKGFVYAGNFDGVMYCLDLKTGEEKWSFKAGNQISGSPNIWESGGKEFLIFGSYDFYLYCLDAGSGKLAWKYETDNFINGAAAIYMGTAVFGGCDGYLHRVDLKNGTSSGKTDVATYVASSAAILDDRAYLGDHDGRFSCIDLKKNTIQWTWSHEKGGLPFLASPSVTGEYVIIGNEDRLVYCLDRQTGTLVWKFNTGFRVDASAVVAGNEVLTANMRGDLDILNIKNGEPRWHYELGSMISGNPALSRSRIYVAASDGYLYCFGE